MGNQASKADSDGESTARLSKKDKKSRKLAVERIACNVNKKSQPVIDKHDEAQAHTHSTDNKTHYNAMFSPQMPAGIVGRQKGWKVYFSYVRVDQRFLAI